MNEHYTKAVTETVHETLRVNGVDATLEEVKDVVKDNDLTGNFIEDISKIYDLCLDEVEEDEDEREDEDEEKNAIDRIAETKKTVEEKIDAVIASLKVGYNFVPGIGGGWCRDEADLEKMRDFVRGALTIAAMNGSFAVEGF